MNEYRRPRKDTVTVGDTVKVAAADHERGWTARLLRLVPREGRTPLAVVTRPPDRAGCAHVDADRLTHKRKPSRLAP